jgi:hypothetical protein
MSETAQQPPDRWTVGVAETDDGHVSTIKCRVGTTEPLPDLTERVTLTAQIERPTSEGMHGPEEGRVLNDLGDRFAAAAGAAGVLVGSVCAKGAKRFIVYASDVSWVEPWEQAVRLETPRRMSVRVEEDHTWASTRAMALRLRPWPL